MTYMALNPKKKRQGNRSPARRSKRRTASHRRSNPVMNMRRSGKRRRNVIKVYNRKRRRSNPAVFGNLRDLAVRSAWAIGGGISTRSAPEMLLGERNAGFFGYVANGVTALVGSALIGKVTKSTAAAESWALGGIVMLTSRIIDDMFKKRLVTFAPATELVQLSGDPAYRLAGDYIDQSFPVPYSSLPYGRPAPLALPSPEVSAAINAGLSGDPTWDTPWN